MGCKFLNLKWVTGIAVLLALVGCGRGTQPQVTKESDGVAGAPARETSLQMPSLEGATVTIDQYKGKMVLVNFWATWCEGCKVEIPWYMEFQKKYKDSGLSVVGVSVDDDGWKSVKPFLEAKQVNYPVVIGDWDLAGRFGITSLPVTLLIDRNGRVADLHVGMVDKDAFDIEIQILVKESASKGPAK